MLWVVCFGRVIQIHPVAFILATLVWKTSVTSRQVTITIESIHVYTEVYLSRMVISLNLNMNYYKPDLTQKRVTGNHYVRCPLPL